MKEDVQPSDAEMRARAISRWEGEGGALEPFSGNARVLVAHVDRARVPGNLASFPRNRRGDC